MVTHPAKGVWNTLYSSNTLLAEYDMRMEISQNKIIRANSQVWPWTMTWLVSSHPLFVAFSYWPRLDNFVGHFV